MEGYPTGLALYIDMTAKEWAYVCYLFKGIGVGIHEENAHRRYMPPATKYASELTIRVDIEYLRKYMRLTYLYHIDLNTQGKDSEEWHGNGLKERNKVIKDINKILNKTIL